MERFCWFLKATKANQCFVCGDPSAETWQHVRGRVLSRLPAPRLPPALEDARRAPGGGRLSPLRETRVDVVIISIGVRFLDNFSGLDKDALSEADKQYVKERRHEKTCLSES